MEPNNTSLGRGVDDIQAQRATIPMPMGEQTVKATDIFDNHRQLVDWVLANDGYFHPDAQIAFSIRKGFHAVVVDGTRLVSGTRVASCPMRITLSVLNALDISPFSSHGTHFPESFLRSHSPKPESLQAFFLMEQLVLGEKSWWAPYIATIPTVQEVTDLQFEEETDVVWLEGTNLKNELSTQTAKWKEMYLQGMGALKNLRWPNALNGEYTWSRFRWAATMFGSRSFTSQVLEDTLPADQARYLHRPAGEDAPYSLVELFSHRFAVLLPLLDLLNHKPGAKVEWQARYSFVGLQILETYESGEELCNNYGPRDNEGLLLAYGFTIPNNPFDHLVISIRPPPGSPLAMARTWKPDLRSDPEKRCFIFNHLHPQSTSAIALETSLFSFDLLDSISVLCANERELQTMFSRQQTLMSYCLGETSKFEDGRIILATLSQLLRDCSARAERLRATDPARKTPPVEPLNSKQHHAKIYRDSQLDIVETAVAVCKFVLKSASSEISAKDILDQLQPQFSAFVFQNLQTLTARHKRLSHQFELLTCEAILAMLPNSLSSTVKKCLSELENILDSTANGEGQSLVNLDKIRLAVILSALYGEYAYGTKLPHRITEWVHQLAEWYPPHGDSWAHVPTLGPWAPGEEPPAALVSLLAARAAMSPTMPVDSNIKRWLRPERICWGWNVMEEEMVRVPTDILGSREAGAGSGQESTSILIYWQRYQEYRSWLNLQMSR
ncbi:uncharacterized protein Z518_08054 [Rhinocladiella mackenziei CBS 650.93]|uniref:SET domain-containing protein n=1 Tax=Rhinocladiella mackenziei CBS 650.93 TaxID=1442369 RepID=A0A0D2IZS3_9EURO|nr:uncharacterized protein Z518_08054 [Rhinocladiella mackenziei CBS 650.93]KIX02115.1 hypothetical protein Z518_08054 [Rhinocladiella mackenziei CBS 650.93]